MRAIVLVLCAACTQTLPFDSLTGGVPKGGPAPTATWHFEEGSGDEVGDARGALGGVIEGKTKPTWTKEGKRGGALEFTTDGSIAIHGLSDASFPRRGTLAQWVRIAVIGAEDEVPIFFALNKDGTQPLDVYVTSVGVFFERVGASDTDTRLTVAAPVVVGTWTLVVATWDADAGTASLFVRPEGAAAPVPVNGDFPPSFAFGSPTFTLSARRGTLDEVRFWNRALSPAEIDALD